MWTIWIVIFFCWVEQCNAMTVIDNACEHENLQSVMLKLGGLTLINNSLSGGILKMSHKLPCLEHFYINDIMKPVIMETVEVARKLKTLWVIPTGRLRINLRFNENLG